MINLDAITIEEALAALVHPDGYPWEINFQFPTELLNICPNVEQALERKGIVITNLNNLDPEISYCQAFSSDYNMFLLQILDRAFGCPHGDLTVTKHQYLGESSREYTDKEDEIYQTFMLQLVNNELCNWEDAITQVNSLHPEQVRDKIRFVGERIRRQVAGIENEKQ